MIKFFSSTLILLFLCIGISFSQTPNWIWAKTAKTTGLGYNDAQAVCTDPFGNVYITGYFYDTVIVGTDTLRDTSGLGVPFISKYNSSGQELWAVKLLHGNESVLSVASDAYGNPYVVGSFFSTTTFGTSTLTCNGVDDIFIAKLSSTGNKLWAKSFGGTGSDIAKGIAINNNIMYVTGRSLSSSFNFGSTTLTYPNSFGYYLAKMDTAGNVTWAQEASGGDSQSLKIDAFNNICITGYFGSSSMTIGSTVLVNNAINMYDSNIFLAKYDPSGNVIWAKCAGGTSSDQAYSVTTDGVGSVYITGYFSSPSIIFNTSTLTNNGNYDIFIAKYDVNGNPIWGKSASGNSIDQANCICTDISNNILITGYFSSPSITFGTTTLNCNGQQNGYVAKYDGSGNVMWVKIIGGSVADASLGIAADAIGNIYSAGYVGSPSVNFDTINILNTAAEASYLSKIQSAAVGIQTYGDGAKVELFPNPNNGAFTLSLAEHSSGIYALKIYNETGALVWEQNINFSSANLKRDIELGDLPKGMYFITILSEKQIEHNKMIIE